jgi:hypothetical protein
VFNDALKTFLLMNTFSISYRNRIINKCSFRCFMKPELWYGREVYRTKERMIIMPKARIYEALQSLEEAADTFSHNIKNPDDTSRIEAHFNIKRPDFFKKKDMIMGPGFDGQYHKMNKELFYERINEYNSILVHTPVLVKDNDLENPELFKKNVELFNNHLLYMHGPVTRNDGVIIKVELDYSKDNSLVKLVARNRTVTDPDVLWQSIKRFAVPARTVSLADKLLEAGITEEELYANHELWSALISIERNEFISKNKSFFAKDKDGAEWMIKITNDKERALIESAANYYLSEKFSFIMPSNAPEPFHSHGVYVTMQKSARNMLQAPRSIDYWLSCLALFHNEALNILRERSITMAPISFRSAEHEHERFLNAKKDMPIHFDRNRLDDAIKYLQRTDGKYLVHNDLKIEHMKGFYLLDLELIGTGHPGIDLATFLMYRRVPYEKWDSYLTKYLEFRGLKGSFEHELKSLKEGVDHGAYARINSEIISSGLRFGKRRNKMTERVLLSYLPKLKA